MSETNEHSAWLAGLIDGEGCISIGRSMRAQCRVPTYQPQVIVKMTNAEILATACGRTALGQVSGPLYQKTPNRKPYWRWVVSNKDAAALLVRIHPWLIVKRQQADLLIEMHRLNGLSKGGRQGMKPEIAAEKERIFGLYKIAQST